MNAQSDTQLADLENTIRREQEAFFEACSAMRAIVEKRLYKARHRSLETYLRAKFGMSRSRAYQLVDCDRVMENLSTKVDKSMLPRNERQVRSLAHLPPDEQLLHWLSIRDGNATKKPPSAPMDRYEALRRWLVQKYKVWPPAERPQFVEVVEKLMQDMRHEHCLE